MFFFFRKELIDGPDSVTTQKFHIIVLVRNGKWKLT